jgi:hypothetical protein
VGPRAGLDVCEKSRHHRDFFFVCFVFVRILSFIVLVLDFQCSFWIVLHCSWIVRAEA